jgi:hypothetical protein
MNRLAPLLAAALSISGCGAPHVPGGTIAQTDATAEMDLDLERDLSGVAPAPMPRAEGPAERGDCPVGAAPDRSLVAAWGALVESCARWQDRGQNTYTYVIQRRFFGPPELQAAVAVEVEQGRVVWAARVEDGVALDPQGFGTIEDVYQELAEVAEQVPYRLDVALDRRTSLPAEVRVDWNAGAMDDWMVIELSLVER